MQAGVRVHDSDHRRDTQSKREDYREADGQLHQRLTPAADQGVNCSFGTTTRACSGRPPMPGASGTSAGADRKSTRLNSSHLVISYAVFCLKKKKQCSLTKTDMMKHYQYS